MAWFNSKLRLLLEPINFNGGGQKQCYFSVNGMAWDTIVNV